VILLRLRNLRGLLECVDHVGCGAVAGAR